MILSWMIIDETNNWAKCIEVKEASQWYDLGWLFMTQTTVSDGGQSKKLDEIYDLVLLLVKRTIDHNGPLPINANEKNDHGWLSMEQSTDHDGCLPKMEMDDTTMVDYPCRKRPITKNAFWELKWRIWSWTITGETIDWCWLVYTYENKWVIWS